MLMKHLNKSKKLSGRAVGSFTQAIKDIERANNLIQTGIDKADSHIDEKTHEIMHLQKEIQSKHEEKIEHTKELQRNNSLIKKLENFLS